MMNGNREEMIYYGGVQIYTELLREKYGRKEWGVSDSQLWSEALETAATMYGQLPKYVKYAKKAYINEKEKWQISNEELE